MDFGTALGRELGLSQDKIDAVNDWRASETLDAREKLVLELAEALTMTPAAVDDDLRIRLESSFSDRQLVELAHTIAWENCRARFNRCFGVEHDGYDLG
ncbi:MAG: hypothetical protein R2754_02595 [Microthrixaceae bacterium]